MGGLRSATAGMPAPSAGCGAAADSRCRASNGPEYSVACPPANVRRLSSRRSRAVRRRGRRIAFGGIRLDKYFDDDLLLTLEAGHAQGAFGVFQTVAQRAKSSGQRRQAAVGASQRSTAAASTWPPPTTATTSPPDTSACRRGRPFNSDSYRVQVEGRRTLLGSRRHDSSGGRRDGVRREDGQLQSGVDGQTFLFRPISSDSEALFAQVGMEAHRPGEDRAGGPRRLELVARFPVLTTRRR